MGKLVRCVQLTQFSRALFIWKETASFYVFSYSPRNMGCGVLGLIEENHRTVTKTWNIFFFFFFVHMPFFPMQQRNPECRRPQNTWYILPLAYLVWVYLAGTLFLTFRITVFLRVQNADIYYSWINTVIFPHNLSAKEIWPHPISPLPSTLQERSPRSRGGDFVESSPWGFHRLLPHGWRIPTSDFWRLALLGGLDAALGSSEPSEAVNTHQ